MSVLTLLALTRNGMAHRGFGCTTCKGQTRSRVRVFGEVGEGGSAYQSPGLALSVEPCQSPTQHTERVMRCFSLWIGRLLLHDSHVTEGSEGRANRRNQALQIERDGVLGWRYEETQRER